MPLTFIRAWLSLVWCAGMSISRFASAKLQRTEKAIEDYRQEIDTRKAESYGFASMAAVAYAHIVAHILRKKHPKGTDIVLAPNPKDIVRRCCTFRPFAA